MTLEAVAHFLSCDVRTVARVRRDPAEQFPTPIMIGRKPLFVRGQVKLWYLRRQILAQVVETQTDPGGLGRQPPKTAPPPARKRKPRG